MKKTFLFFACACAAYTSKAQVTLTGTTYTQNFNTLGASLPTGWHTYNNATATSLGSLEALTSNLDGYPSMLRPDTSCAGLVVGGGFKNFPSANVCSPGDNWCAAPPSYSDRALGVRQVSPTNGSHPNLDPGAAFGLEIANTTGITGVNLSFKLQSLDTSSIRVTTWSVDYGFGATPSAFTPATTVGTMVTGGNVFSNNTVTVDFGSALDNQAGPVWIRVVALTATSGSYNRASSAIDDYTLTYNNTTGISNVAANGSLSLGVLGYSTSSLVDFNCNAAEAGNYTLTICDMTGRSVYTENVQLNAGGQTHTVNANLAAGIYVARISNGTSMATTKVVVR